MLFYILLLAIIIPSTCLNTEDQVL